MTQKNLPYFIKISIPKRISYFFMSRQFRKTGNNRHLLQIYGSRKYYFEVREATFLDSNTIYATYFFRIRVQRLDQSTFVQSTKNG